MTWLNDIRNRVKTVPISGGRSDKTDKNMLDDIIFAPAQVSKRPVDYFKEDINTETVIGEKSKRPLKLDIPLMIGAMSFGALSKEAKVAIAKGANKAGTVDNTGEGGMLPEERDAAKKLIMQYSSGRFGASEDQLKRADAIEIKIGQGAKPGQGGLLPAGKVTEEIAKVRGVEQNKDIHSPAYHPDIKNMEDLKERIDYLRSVVEGPVIVKLGGPGKKDIEMVLKSDPDAVSIDGMEGGTGAAPQMLLDHIGMPTLASLKYARKAKQEMGADQNILIGGGFNKGADVAKAMALGADGVFMGFPLLVAMGCTYCKQCYKGLCPKGIATQKPELREKFDIDESSEKVAGFLKNVNEEVKMVAGAVGCSSVHELNMRDLKSLNSDVSKISGVGMV